MPLDADDHLVSKPLEPVVQNMDALLDTYDSERARGEDPAEAFVHVVERVLTHDAARDLLAYLEGRDDHMLGQGAGRAAGDRLLESFEHEHLQRASARSQS
jgi:hypothetical protein